jgi:hypothetical protein
VLLVVSAVAEEVVRARHALGAGAHDAGATHARLLARQAVGPLERRAGVLKTADAGEVDTAVLAACAVVVVPVHARAVLEEAGAGGLGLHQCVAAVVQRVVEAEVVARAQRAVEVLLVARRVAEVAAQSVAVEADDAGPHAVWPGAGHATGWKTPRGSTRSARHGHPPLPEDAQSTRSMGKNSPAQAAHMRQDFRTSSCSSARATQASSATCCCSWCSQKAAGQSTGQVAAAPQSADSDEMMSPGRAGE